MGPAVHALDTSETERNFLNCAQIRAECVTYSCLHTADIRWWAPSLQHVCYSPRVWEQESLDHTMPEKEKNQICTSLKSLHTSFDLCFYLHVGKLLHRRKTRQVEPGHVLPVFVIISFVLQISEGGTTQSVKFQSILLPIWTCNNIDIYGGKKAILSITYCISFSLS